MLIIRNTIALITFFIFIGCGSNTNHDRTSELETSTLKKSINKKVEKLTVSEELSERRYASQVLAPLMTASNSYWQDSDTLSVDFEILTYSPKDDLSFDVCFYSKNNNEGMSLVTCERDISSSYISHSGYGTYVLHNGGVRQNKIKINFNKSFASSQLSQLKPNMYYRVFVSNNYIQDDIGYANGFQWSGTKFTLYVPKILDNNLHDTNNGYEGTNQDNAQRYIQVSTTNRVNKVISKTIKDNEKGSKNKKVEKLTVSEELSERRYASQVLAPLMTASNSYWQDSDTLSVDFEILTYSPKDDLSFDVCFYSKNNNEGMSLVTCERDISSSYISHSGYGTYVLHNGGVRQNKIKINFNKSFASSQLSQLKPNMYYRVFVSNNYIQDDIGYANGFQWSGTKFTLYVPKILDNNLHDTNNGYEGTNQDNAQRYIQIINDLCNAPTYTNLFNTITPTCEQRWNMYSYFQINKILQNQREIIRAKMDGVEWGHLAVKGAIQVAELALSPEEKVVGEISKFTLKANMKSSLDTMGLYNEEASNLFADIIVDSLMESLKGTASPLTLIESQGTKIIGITNDLFGIFKLDSLIEQNNGNPRIKPTNPTLRNLG